MKSSLDCTIFFSRPVTFDLFTSMNALISEGMTKPGLAAAIDVNAASYLSMNSSTDSALVLTHSSNSSHLVRAFSMSFPASSFLRKLLTLSRAFGPVISSTVNLSKNLSCRPRFNLQLLPMLSINNDAILSSGRPQFFSQRANLFSHPS